MKSRRISCPEHNDAFNYRAENGRGEVLECSDIAPLLRRIAADAGRDNSEKWTIETIRSDAE
jgi:hypothetical protein